MFVQHVPEYENAVCSLEDRAAGWGILTTAILKFPEPPSLPSKDANGAAGKDGSATKEGIPPRGPKDRQAPRPRRPQPLIKLVMRRWTQSTHGSL
jgi:hypothetical protein